LILGEPQYFVWDTASHSSKLLNMIKIWGTYFLSPPGYANESSNFLWHHLANLDHNHLATLAVSTIHSRLSCHDANWRTHAESKVVIRQMPCPHTLWFSRCWDIF